MTFAIRNDAEPNSVRQTRDPQKFNRSDRSESQMSSIRFISVDQFKCHRAVPSAHFRNRTDFSISSDAHRNRDEGTLSDESPDSESMIKFIVATMDIVMPICRHITCLNDMFVASTNETAVGCSSALRISHYDCLTTSRNATRSSSQWI
jgi:hypothetical protein